MLEFINCFENQKRINNPLHTSTIRNLRSKLSPTSDPGTPYGFQVVSDCVDAFLLSAKGVSFPCQKENPTPNWLSESGGKRSCQSSRRDESRGGGENEVRLRRIMFASSLMMVANSTVCMCAYFVYVCLVPAFVHVLWSTFSPFVVALVHRYLGTGNKFMPHHQRKNWSVCPFLGFSLFARLFSKGFFLFLPKKRG